MRTTFLLRATLRDGPLPNRSRNSEARGEELCKCHRQDQEKILTQ
jgi:hypothetical protein